jgi:hypothetical protein
MVLGPAKMAEWPFKGGFAGVCLRRQCSAVGGAGSQWHCPCLLLAFVAQAPPAGAQKYFK